MKRITIYRHLDCARCAKIARFHKAFDWLGRIKESTETPPSGPLRLGEIAVEDHRNGEITKGVEAVRKVFRQVPAYWPFLPLMYIPAIARKVDADVRGCDGESCAVPVEGTGTGRRELTD
jgi:hypothetical protein